MKFEELINGIKANNSSVTDIYVSTLQGGKVETLEQLKQLANAMIDNSYVTFINSDIYSELINSYERIKKKAEEAGKKIQEIDSSISSQESTGYEEAQRYVEFIEACVDRNYFNYFIETNQKLSSMLFFFVNFFIIPIVRGAQLGKFIFSKTIGLGILGGFIGGIIGAFISLITVPVALIMALKEKVQRMRDIRDRKRNHDANYIDKAMGIITADNLDVVINLYKNLVSQFPEKDEFIFNKVTAKLEELAALDTAANYVLGFFYQKESPSQAIENFAKVDESHPNYENAMSEGASIAFVEKQYDEAKNFLEHAKTAAQGKGTDTLTLEEYEAMLKIVNEEIRDRTLSYPGKVFDSTVEGHISKPEKSDIRSNTASIISSFRFWRRSVTPGQRDAYEDLVETNRIQFTRNLQKIT
jgi:gas vesicle protein